MEFQIILKPSAEKQLDRVPPPARRRILSALEVLRREPRPAGTVKLAGDQALWRIRVGDYRVVYEIHGDRLVILVVRIGHRKDVYRG